MKYVVCPHRSWRPRMLLLRVLRWFLGGNTVCSTCSHLPPNPPLPPPPPSSLGSPSLCLSVFPVSFFLSLQIFSRLVSLSTCSTCVMVYLVSVDCLLIFFWLFRFSFFLFFFCFSVFCLSVFFYFLYFYIFFCVCFLFFFSDLCLSVIVS